MLLTTTTTRSFAATAMLVGCMLSPRAQAADAAPSLASLAWLSGCWASDGGEPGSGEHWMPLAGNSLLGMSRTVRAGATVAHEFMRIADAPDGKLSFFAQPSGKPAASFAVLKLSANEVVFENLEHPFPQRILYRLESPTRLHASIEGLRNGAIKSFAYPMVRVSCDALLAQASVRP